MARVRVRLEMPPSRRRFLALACALSVWLPTATLAAPAAPLFDGSTLSGWQARGAGKWRVVNREIVGSADKGGAWLMLDRGFEDFVLRFSFRATGGEAGVVLRNAPASWSRYAHPSKQAGERTIGLYAVLSGVHAGELSLVTLDARGKELERRPLSPVPPIDFAAAYNGKLSLGVCTPEPCDGINDARGPERGQWWLSPVQIGPLEAGWQQVEITLRGAAAPWDRTSVGASLNELSQFGELGLHVTGGPKTTVHIKDISIVDLTQRAAGVAANARETGFRQLTDLFYSEGVAVGDLDRDGHDEVVAGPFYYTGPDFKSAREIYPPTQFSPGKGVDGGSYSHCFLAYVHDFTGDGWPDILQIMGFGQLTSFSAHLFVNPRGELRHWDNYNVIPIISSETTQLTDVDGDGRPELILSQNDRMGYASPDASDPTRPWVFHPVSEKVSWLYHGVGEGDVNGDGRKDILQAQGWWEQPAAGVSGLWQFHAASFGAGDSPYGPIGGADIFVYDVNNDGLPDVITSLNAHGPGLAWFEQQRDTNGNSSWQRHLIMGDPGTASAERQSWEETDKSTAFTELHALALADLDGNGSIDIVTGKRWWSHGYHPGENDRDDPPVLYGFELVRKPGGAVEWVPKLIHAASGIGTQFVAKDLDHDGKPEIVTSARKGTFVFFAGESRR